MTKQLAPFMKALQAAEPRFKAIAETKTAIDINWAAECGYAVQRIKQNEALQRCPGDTIRDAVVNVAAVGLSLNPALKHAYLVPRDGICTLDISYMGLCHLAELSGAIRYVRADVVRSGDNFIWRGLDEKPIHEIANPFDDEERSIVGVYCYAMTSDGHYLAGKMSRKEIETVRQTSKAPNSPAWKNWYGEMAKKAIIKREQKLWPKAAREMVGQAIQVINETEGLKTTSEFDAEQETQHYADVKRQSEQSQSETVEKSQDESDVIEGDFEEVTGMQEGTQRIITRKLQACNLEEGALFKAMEVKGWSELKQSDAAGCMDWINSESAA